jgi:Mn-dependent DtxR family transcriptional regulator
MIEKIGETAGEIWRILKEREEVNISQLPRLLNEKSAVVYQAVGWLARENKIEYKTVGAKTLVSLTESER